MTEHAHEGRFETEAQAGEWDSRYSDAGGSMWSGRPNGRLVAEAAALAPGAALDVGFPHGHVYTAGSNRAAAIWAPPDFELYDDAAITA